MRQPVVGFYRSDHDYYRDSQLPVTDDQVTERLVQILNDGAIAVLASLGHQTGLFDALADLPPATSEQIADAAGLNERYVREWLGGVVTGGFVDYDAGAGRYALRPELASFLTGAGADNLARSMRLVTLMGEVSSLVTEKFRTGGGLAYADYPNFHAVMAEESAAVNDASLLDTIVPLDRSGREVARGHRRGRRGLREGHAINLLAQVFPASRFTGIDFSDEALTVGRADAAAWGLTNVTLRDPGRSHDRLARRTTSSWRSTPFTTRPSRRRCWPTSIARCGPTAPF